MDLPQVEDALVRSRLNELAQRAQAASRPAPPPGGGIYGPGGGYGPPGGSPPGYSPPGYGAPGGGSPGTGKGGAGSGIN